jgi:hypothetical protein
MRYFRSFIVGLLTALIMSVIWVLFREMAATVEMSRMIAASPEGSGGIAGVVVVTEASVLAAALAGFLVGFLWRFRRASKVRQLPRSITNG